MARPVAGDIVIVAYRGARKPDEPSGTRPSVVVEDSTVFDDAAYRNLLVVPLSTDARFGLMSDLVERIDPTPDNGCTEPCWALAHHVASVALARCQVPPTPARVTDAQLATIRAKIVYAVGGDG